MAELNRRLESGSQRLDHDAETGYLKSVLEALKLSTKSQVLVYSKTSLQAPRISPSNPRALYFADDVVVGYIRGARQAVIEIVRDTKPDLPEYFRAASPR